MEDNTQDLQKQLSDVKEQLNWLRQNFNEEINILIKENRELKEQVKSKPKVLDSPVEVHTDKLETLSFAPPSDEVQISEPVAPVTPDVIQTNPIHEPQAPEEISSIRWVLEWIVCKSKDWFVRFPCTIALLVYHIFAIQYHKHLCNKR
jgi:hypothetical protein